MHDFGLSYSKKIMDYSSSSMNQWQITERVLYWKNTQKSKYRAKVGSNKIKFSKIFNLILFTGNINSFVKRH